MHGVVCEDETTISFQPYDTFSDVVLYHAGPPRKPNEPVRPVEFRRRVLLVPDLTKPVPSTTDDEDNPADEKQRKPRFVPTVEVYPLKLVYSIVAKEHGSIDSDIVTPKETAGFLLISSASTVAQTMPMVAKTAAPQMPLSCVRLWSKRLANRQQTPSQQQQQLPKIDATQKGDGYDLVLLDELDGKLIRKEEQVWKEQSTLEMGEWAYRQTGPTERREVEILVETRASASMPWARVSLEFPNRLQVGDFCDAQDTTGKWYEAVVREISEDKVKVHFMGWASRWDGIVRRYADGTAPAGVPKVRYLHRLNDMCRSLTAQVGRTDCLTLH